jgi:hypothetical protein
MGCSDLIRMTRHPTMSYGMTRSCEIEHISLLEPKHDFRVRWCYQLPYQGEFDLVLMVCVCSLCSCKGFKHLHSARQVFVNGYGQVLIIPIVHIFNTKRKVYFKVPPCVGYFKILEECQDRSFLEGGRRKKNPSTHITQVKLKANQPHQQEWNMLKEEEEYMQNPSTTRLKLEQ